MADVSTQASDEQVRAAQPAGRFACPVCGNRDMPLIPTPLGVLAYLHPLGDGPCPGVYRPAVWTAQVQDSVPEHLAVTRSGRGFARMPTLEGTYPRTSVHVSESSAADYPALWLTADDQSVTQSGEQARIHLDAQVAWQLAEQIMLLCAQHYQGDVRPDITRYLYPTIPETES